jgi:hypothetical protein
MNATVSRMVAAIAAAAVLCCLGVGTTAAVVGPPHHIAVPPGIGKGRVMVLRPHRIDLFNGGRYGRSIYLDGQHATLNGLADAIGDPAFLSRPAPGTLLVTAALTQRPDTNLVVGGAGLRTVELRADPVSPALLTGTRATVSFIGVTVTGTGPGAPAGRPYLSYGGSSIVRAAGSRFAHLGRPGSHPLAALEVGKGATVTVSHVVFSDDVIGLAAANTAAVRLSFVNASRSSADGIVLRNAGVVWAGNISVNGNHEDGLLLAGAGTHLSVTGGLTAIGNGRFGIMASSAVAAAISGARTQGNGVAGVNVHDAGVCSVLGLASDHEPVAVRIDSGAKFTADTVTATHDRIGISATARSQSLRLHSIIVSGAVTGLLIDSAHVTADGVTVSGAGLGLHITSSAHDVNITGLAVTSATTNSGTNGPTTGAVVSGDSVTLTDSRIEGARFGLLVTGSHTTIKSGKISATGTVVAVRDHADATTVAGVTISGGTLGFSVAAGSGAIALDNDVISGSSRAALRAGGGTTTVTSSTLTSTGTAIEGYAPVTVTGSSITAAVGAHIASGVVAQFAEDQIHGSITGIHVVDGGHVSVINSQVTGHAPISGKASVLGLSFIGPLPLHWLGACGLALLVLALFLVALSRSRERSHERSVLAPTHVTNRA